MPKLYKNNIERSIFMLYFTCYNFFSKILCFLGHWWN